MKTVSEYYVAVGPSPTFNDLLNYQRICKLYLKRENKSSSNFTSSSGGAYFRSPGKCPRLQHHVALPHPSPNCGI